MYMLARNNRPLITTERVKSNLIDLLDLNLKTSLLAVPECHFKTVHLLTFTYEYFLLPHKLHHCNVSFLFDVQKCNYCRYNINPALYSEIVH